MSEIQELKEAILNEVGSWDKKESYLAGLVSGLAVSAVAAVTFAVATQGPEAGGDSIDDCIKNESSGVVVGSIDDSDPYDILTKNNSAIDAANKQNRDEWEAEREGKTGISIFIGKGGTDIGQLACLDPETQAMMLTVDGMILRSEIQAS